jgi:hypothetical protein
MLKIQLNTPITGAKRTPVETSDGPLTLRQAMLIALAAANPDARGTTPEEAVKTRQLFDRIDAAESEMEISPEEATKLKLRLAARLSELVAGQAILLLEPS